MDSNSERKKHFGTIKVNFRSQDHARMVMLSLQVDEELQPTRIERQIQIEENSLLV